MLRNIISLMYQISKADNLIVQYMDINMRVNNKIQNIFRMNINSENICRGAFKIIYLLAE